MRKRKIGLALGAGAARGWSHIGVLNALEKLGLQADIVVGCSIGSLVGAAYACHKLHKLENWIRTFGYWDVLKMMDLSWSKGGLLQGNRVFDLLSGILKVKDITECPITFATVATNITTGRELWLTEGNLKQAIRASCSMPGLLAPVRLHGDLLVDGAVVNPLPISLARALGADIVIGVNLQYDANITGSEIITRCESKKEAEQKSWHQELFQRLTSFSAKGPSTLQIMSTAIEILENRLKNSRMALDPPDILISPYCPQISVLDFHRAEEAILAGQLAVQKEQERIELLLKDCMTS